MNKNTLIAATIAVGLGSVAIDSAEACSRVTWPTEQGVFVSRTFDWIESSHAAIENFPAGTEYTRSLRPDAKVETAKYALAAVTSYGVLIGEAVNEKGLAGNVLFFDEMNISDVADSEAFGHARILHHLLAQYSQVDEAVKALKQVDMLTDNIPGMPTVMTVHYSLQDTSGNNAIIQWQDGELKIWEGPEHQVLTNSPEYQVHLANLEKLSSMWGPTNQQTAQVNIGSNANIHSTDRFIHNNYFLRHLKEPSSITNGLMKLESAIYTIAHDAPNREVGDQMAGYGSEWVLTQNLNTGDAVLRYTWEDTNNFMLYNVKALMETGKRLRFDVTQPGLYGDITAQIIEQGQL